MFILDEARTGRHQEAEKAAAQREQTAKWIEQQLQDAVWADDPDELSSNKLKQMGRPMHHNDLERRLKKLVPNLIFQWNQFNSTKKMMYLQLPNGKLQSICPYEAGIMPERSVMNTRIVEIPDPNAARSNKGIGHINRKDLPAYEVTPNPNSAIGVDIHFLGALPNMLYVRRPWSEQVRGWRTVLVNVVKAGLLSPELVEREFGVLASESWGRYMGRR